jgi:two-component system nitrogen regulation sensor histidine kinase NtrY
VVSLLLFLSVVISINFASRLTKPVINLIGASEKISSGDLHAKVPEIEGDKDFEKLNENFNSMIDKLKIQQDKLLMSERHAAWENVARKLAHEIKNPLTPIQLSIDRIREKYLDKVGEENRNLSGYLNTMNKQIKDIEHLLNEFSDFARMPKPVFKRVNINQIINRVIDLHSLSESNIEFIIKKNKTENYLSGDQEQLNRVFINLIKNSIESISEKRTKNVDFKGKISIDIKDDSDYIYVTVKDNGVGFDRVDKKKMLTPYFTTKKDGTGLGLAIVTKIISDHNSIILFDSIKNGAKVEITIPKHHA